MNPFAGVNSPCSLTGVNTFHVKRRLLYSFTTGLRSAATHAAWRRLTTLLLVMALVLGATGCTTGVNPVSGNRRAYGYSWEEEQKLGKQADQQIVQQYGVYDDEEVQQYLDRIAQDILEESHMRRSDTPEKFRNTEFTFRVLDSPVVNAFALPGGYVYITRGLMSHLNNEAQLAVVIGHEIAHVAARHASQQAAKQQFAQLGLIAGAIGGEIAGISGGDILQLGGQAAQLLFLKYSRDNERESDQLGVEYAAMNGYEVSEAAAFFESLERIQEQSGQSLPTWQSSHPDPGAREQTIRQLADKWRERLQQPLDEIDQDAYYTTLDGLVLGENPRHGFVRNEVFYHPDLEFQFPVPGSFEVINQPTQVALVGPEQNAVIQFNIADAETPRAAASEIIDAEGVTVVDQGTMSAGNLSGYFVEVDAETQEGQVLRVLNFNVAYDGRVYRFLGYARRADFSTHRSTFLQTMRGFAPLNDPNILNVQPTRITIRRASQAAPFDSFLPSTLPDDLSPTRMAILNQVELNQQIEPNRPLKLPE